MRARPIVFFSALASVACGTILGLPEVTVDDTIGADGSTPPDGAKLDVASDAPASDADGAQDAGCGDTTSDPKNCGSCGHDCLGGACTMGKCQPALVTSNTNLIAPFAMTQTDNDLVFTNLRGLACGPEPCSSAKIGKDKTLGSATILADYSKYMMVDGVPWAIAQANMTDFYTSIQSNFASGGKWRGGVDRCPLSTGCTTTNLAIPYDVSQAVDSDGMNVFMDIRYDDMQFNSHYEIWKTDLALNVSTKTVLAVLGDNVNGIISDANNVYYSNANGVYKCTKSSCVNNVGDRLTSTNIEAYNMAQTTSDIYFVSDASIERVSKSGGGDAQIKANLNVPFGIAVDNAYVYFTEIGNTQNPMDGKVYRCPLSGCTPQTEIVLATGDNPRPIVTDSKAIYWGTRTGKIFRLAK